MRISFDTRVDLVEWISANAGTNDEQMDRLRRNLSRAIQTELTERQRTMLLMRYSQNYSQTEIAAELGVNPSTVSRTLLRAEKRLQRALRYSF